MGTRAIFCLILSFVAFNGCLSENLNQKSFPEKFLFGVATASYQIEGAWNTNGKGESIWDRFTHSNPSKISDGSNGDVACDSYHKYKEDVQLIRNLGVDYYRFSLSWSRILPNGFNNVVNEEGINYYNNLINELIKYNITPVITVFHWDLPQALQDIGGWPNPLLIDIYYNYAKLVFEKFGDRVKMWITFNEPKQICKMGYGDGILAPGLKSSGVGDYLCAYTVLKAHAKAYRFYKETQNGIIGFTVDSFWFQPGSESLADQEAADRLFQFYVGTFTNPIYGSGDFPAVVKDFIGNRSHTQGYLTSRLPEFTPDEVNYIKGTSDFFGLNFYTAILVENTAEYDLSIVSWETDARIRYWRDPTWKTASGSSWLSVVPWSFSKTLKKLKSLYGDIPIYVTENGYSDFGELKDYERINYHLTYLSSCLDAIWIDQVNLVGYTAWSLLDNFEWVNGYVGRFGLHYVDFNDPNRPRTPKLSAEVFTEIVKDRKLPNTTLDVPEGGGGGVGSICKPLRIVSIALLAILITVIMNFISC